MIDSSTPASTVTHAADGATMQSAGHPPSREHVNAAWMLAVRPLAVAAIRIPATYADISPKFISVLALAASFGLVIADHRMLEHTGRLANATGPSIWRALLPPVDLYARARRLGTKLIMFWPSLCCIVIGGLVGLTMAIMIAEASIPPGCGDDATVNAAIGAFDNTLLVREAGISSIDVTHEAETAQGPGPKPRAVMHGGCPCVG